LRLLRRKLNNIKMPEEAMMRIENAAEPLAAVQAGLRRELHLSQDTQQVGRALSPKNLTLLSVLPVSSFGL